VNCFHAGHLEHRFGVRPEGWKEIEVHIDSKCRSASRWKWQGLSETLRRRAVDQSATASFVSGTSCSDDTGLQPQHDSLTAEVQFTLLFRSGSY